MVKLPNTLVREIQPGKDKTVSFDTLRNKFILNGYGPKKAKNWIDYYFDIGVLERIAADDGEIRVTCLWW